MYSNGMSMKESWCYASCNEDYLSRCSDVRKDKKEKGRTFVGKRLWHGVQWATTGPVNTDSMLCLLQLSPRATFSYESLS